VHLKANKNFKQDKIQLAFCSLRSPILANYILPLKWALVAPTNKINIYFSVWRISQMFIVCFVLLCGNFTVFKCLAFLAKQFRLNGFGASSLNSL
jgi:hypothetical protein